MSVNPVIFLMGADKSYPYDLILKINFYNEPIVVSPYIENHPGFPQNANLRILFFNIISMFPIALFSFTIPSFELLFAVGICGPEIPQDFFCNYPQVLIFL